MFWWGISRKSSIWTTCNLPLQVVKHLNRRRWWHYKVWAQSKIIIFDGAQTKQCWPESERTLAAIAGPTFWWGILRKGSIRTTCNLPLQVVKHLNRRRWWLYKGLGPIQNYNFWRGSNQTALTWVRKNSIKPKVLVRHLAQEFHPNNM